MDIKAFWNDVISQNKDALTSYFCDDAIIRWHCTKMDSMIVYAGRVLPRDKEASYHVVSFVKLANGLIYEMDEYWSDDGEAPMWRKEMNIGKAIR